MSGSNVLAFKQHSLYLSLFLNLFIILKCRQVLFLKRLMFCHLLSPDFRRKWENWLGSGQTVLPVLLEPVLITCGEGFNLEVETRSWFIRVTLLMLVALLSKERYFIRQLLISFVKLGPSYCQFQQFFFFITLRALISHHYVLLIVQWFVYFEDSFIWFCFQDWAPFCGRKSFEMKP